MRLKAWRVVSMRHLAVRQVESPVRQAFRVVFALCCLCCCLSAGLPQKHHESVRNIQTGMPIFLYNYSVHQLHGVFEVSGRGIPSRISGFACPGLSVKAVIVHRSVGKEGGSAMGVS